MDHQELKNILELHRKWVVGEENGKRADLSYANLSSANLSSANLSSANLSSADLRYADLRYANLRYADLSSANLSSANLRYADLRYANLRYADLRSADLSSIVEDFNKRLLLAKNEVVGLYDALVRGKVDGSSYEGECACFVGTIANIRKEKYDGLKIDLRPEADSQTERWFMGIRKGDVPQSNQVVKLTVEWVEAFAKEHSIVLPRYKLVSSLDFPEVFK